MSRAPLWGPAGRSGGLVRRSGGAAVAIALPRRGYFWPYHDDFVPKGAATSRFQASAVPSERRRVLHEYCLAPLFGSDGMHNAPQGGAEGAADAPLNSVVRCCTLGFLESAGAVLPRKSSLRRVLSDLLLLPPVAGGAEPPLVELGGLVQLSDMLLHKANTPLSPRLAAVRGAAPPAERQPVRARDPFAQRGGVRARTLVDVFLPLDVDPRDVQEAGALLQEQLAQCHRGEDRGRDAPVGDGADEHARQLALVRELVRLGVTHCELPAAPDVDVAFHEVDGDAVDGDDAARVVERWERRVHRAAPPSPSS